MNPLDFTFTSIGPRAPVLVEPSVRRVITDALNRYHTTRIANRDWIFNFILGSVFVGVIIGAIVIIRIRRLSPAKVAENERAMYDSVRRHLQEYARPQQHPSFEMAPF